MPIGDDGCVHFTTILFALVRESLQIKMGAPEEMDSRDEDMRHTLLRLWPKKARKLMHSLVPFDHELGCGKLTVGKIYATTILAENYKFKKHCQFQIQQISSVEIHENPDENHSLLIETEDDHKSVKINL